MASYRQSSFDPSASERPGPPLRPFNFWQWLGVAFLGLALLFLVLEVAGWLGLIRGKDFGVGIPGLAAASIALINSRREPAGVQRRATRRTMILLLVALAAFGAGLIAILYFKGAH